MARWFTRNLCRLKNDKPIVSFTFDDFPRSALTSGGAILHERGYTGTYYTSLGLMGKRTSTGEIFLREDLDELARQGHEAACHTFDHYDSWGTEPVEFEASIIRNQQAAKELLQQAPFTNFSYPISWPRPDTKRRVAAHYECARGCGQTFNAGVTDLNYLKAFFIEQSRDNVDAIREVIDANAQSRGWLIFATHDVCNSPTRFGCTPALFEEVVNYSVKSGAVVLPVHAALEKVRQGPIKTASVKTSSNVPAIEHQQSSHARAGR